MSFCLLGSRDVIVLYSISFPGIQKPLEQYGGLVTDGSDNSPARDAPAEDDDDDDFDLFGSDDEEAVSRVPITGHYCHLVWFISNSKLN